ncbi:hypothetical protein [Paludifilum halophilum]|uniref:DUF3325 domain-containing protein n=1 Tax=Paludifilum halophilum TaxID=1642702 RepID=A0A235BBS4_9BACL|nr:hypothetical protein [Paludifilum halophilum]OYD09736.1 hypothetical protein CHM34_01695 [Paludifilum halophilum]
MKLSWILLLLFILTWLYRIAIVRECQRRGFDKAEALQRFRRMAWMAAVFLVGTALLLGGLKIGVLAFAAAAAGAMVLAAVLLVGLMKLRG